MYRNSLAIIRQALIMILVVCFPSIASGSPKTIVCDYSKYASPDGLVKVEKKFQLNFIIDSKTDKTYLLGNAGTEEVSMISGEYGMTFVEITGVGNVMTTTVLPNGESVHSRNSVILGDLIPSQYYGTCQFK